MCAPVQHSQREAAPRSQPSIAQSPPAVSASAPVPTPPVASSEPAPVAPERAAPREHRPAGGSCSTERVAGDPQRGPHSKCSHDTQCRRGKNGRCGPKSYEGRHPDVCYYDECYVDDDCAPGTACACGGGSATSPHRCVPGNCRTDADCDPAAPFCSPTFDCKGVTGYYCHTAGDECFSDDDCKGRPSPKCTHNGARWACGWGPNCI